MEEDTFAFIGDELHPGSTIGPFEVGYLALTGHAVTVFSYIIRPPLCEKRYKTTDRYFPNYRLRGVPVSLVINAAVYILFYCASQ